MNPKTDDFSFMKGSKTSSESLNESFRFCVEPSTRWLLFHNNNPKPLSKPSQEPLRNPC